MLRSHGLKVWASANREFTKGCGAHFLEANYCEESRLNLTKKPVVSMHCHLLNWLRISTKLRPLAIAHNLTFSFRHFLLMGTFGFFWLGFFFFPLFPFYLNYVCAKPFAFTRELVYTGGSWSVSSSQPCPVFRFTAIWPDCHIYF